MDTGQCSNANRSKCKSPKRHKYYIRNILQNFVYYVCIINYVYIGSPGSKGLRGLKGIAGTPGTDGGPGSKGELGPSGSGGIVGDKGETGSSGRSGQPGRLISKYLLSRVLMCLNIFILQREKYLIILATIN